MRQKNSYTEIHLYKKTNRQTFTYVERQTDKQLQRKKGIGKEREREREIERE